MFASIPKRRFVAFLALALAFRSVDMARATVVDPIGPKIGTLHVLTVGVAKAGVNKKEALLPGADRNAEDVAAFFQKQENKLYQQVQARKLVNEEATRVNILAELDCLHDQFQPGDMAVVHVSAHGGRDRGHWFMAAYDDPWSMWSTAGQVTEKDMRERLEKLPGQVILILDSCHAGAFGDGVSNWGVEGEAGLVIYAAALHDQYGWFNSLRDHGYFTLALLEALEGKADTNGDGVVTLAEVDAYVATRVAELTPWSKELCVRRGMPAKDQAPTMSKPVTISSNSPFAVVVRRARQMPMATD